MSLPRYLEYNDSGLPLLGSIPAHWSVARLKEVIRSIESGVSVNATDVPATEGAIGVLKTSCVYDGTFRVAENKAVVEEDLSRVSCPVTEGTLIVSRMNTPALVGAAGLVTQSHPNIYLPDRLWQVSLRSSSPSFLHYWTLSAGYRAQVEVACSGTSSSMQNLGQDQFRNFQIALPLEDEQHAIAIFLDRETAKIDALIAEQKQLLALLAEKRQATISHAVTRGLNPDTPMKDSGVPWQGEVPAHWQQKKLIDLAAKEQHTFVNGPFGSDLLTSELVAEGVPVVYIRDIKDAGYLRVSEWHVTNEKAAQIKFCSVIPGDVIIAKVGDPPGLAAVYPDGEPDGIVTQDVIRLRVDRAMAVPSYLRLLLNSDYGRALVDDISVESTRTRVGLGGYKQLRFFIPPVDEQENIAACLEHSMSALAALKTAAESVIGLLRERRSALISAAVTGKIDVRHAA